MDLLRVAMDAIEAMTVLRNRRILSVFAAVSYPRQYCNIYDYTDRLDTPNHALYPTARRGVIIRRGGKAPPILNGGGPRLPPHLMQ